MTDEKNKTSGDDEYQFPHDEYVDADHEQEKVSVGSQEGAASPAKPRGPIGKIFDLARNVPEVKNKRIVLAIIGIVFLIIVFHLIKKDNSTLPPVTKEPEQTQAVQASVSVPAPVPVVAQPVAPIDGNNTDMMGSLDTLKESHSKTESKLHDLEGQVSDLQSSLTQSQATTQQLQKSVEALTSQVQTLSEQLDKVMTKNQPKTARVVYHLRAVVPDRAWIISSNGDTVSVTIGDHIDQYGKVVSIDSANGVIDTSSGRKIEYGTNDY